MHKLKLVRRGKNIEILTGCGAWSDDVNAALSADFQGTPVIGIRGVARVQGAPVVVLLAENAAHVAAAAPSAVYVRLAEGVVGFFEAPSGIGQCQFLILMLAAALVAHGFLNLLQLRTCYVRLGLLASDVLQRCFRQLLYIQYPIYSASVGATHIWHITSFLQKMS